MRIFKELIIAWGHPNVTATHKTTFEITRDGDLTKRGDCIIGVLADKSVKDLSYDVKGILRIKNNIAVKLEIFLPQYGLKDSFFGYGSERLVLDHPTDIVVRKSDFICGRTLLINADKSASEINREIVDLLKDTSTELNFSLIIEKI